MSQSYVVARVAAWATTFPVSCFAPRERRSQRR
jgi:hypothetical protein